MKNGFVLGTAGGGNTKPKKRICIGQGSPYHPQDKMTDEFTFDYGQGKKSLDVGHLGSLMKIAMIVLDDRCINKLTKRIDKKRQIIVNLLRIAARSNDDEVFGKIYFKMTEHPDVVSHMMFLARFLLLLDKDRTMETVFDEREEMSNKDYLHQMELLKTINTFTEVIDVLMDGKTEIVVY